MTLNGLKVVLDCANGASYRVAPTVLWELGAEVVPIGVEPDGFNINRDCGSTQPAAMSRAVVESRADLGMALDGDADRVVLCDETGALIDGDQLMALVAEQLAGSGRLAGGGVVATLMSNLGLERHLEGLGLHLARTRVGDRYVVEHMRAHGYNLGGEQSGHIILTDYATTGDGLVAALQALAVIAAREGPVSRAARRFEPLPQRLRSVPCSGAEVLKCGEVEGAIGDAETMLGSGGRVLVRMSGTEPKARVMAEGEDEALVARAVERVVSAIEHMRR
jgi:phosphoglucosamine mutase